MRAFRRLALIGLLVVSFGQITLAEQFNLTNLDAVAVTADWDGDVELGAAFRSQATQMVETLLQQRGIRVLPPGSYPRLHVTGTVRSIDSEMWLASLEMRLMEEVLVPRLKSHYVVQTWNVYSQPMAGPPTFIKNELRGALINFGYRFVTKQSTDNTP